MTCDRGIESGRDGNSAIDIMVRSLSQNAKWISYGQFVDDLRKTGLDISLRYSQEAPTDL